MSGRPLPPHPSIASSLLRIRSLAMRRLLLFVLVSLLSPLAWAQSTLSGTVRTSDGVPLPQVAIVLEKPGGALRRVTTGPAGHYRIDGLAAGDYTIRVEAPGL